MSTSSGYRCSMARLPHQQQHWLGGRLTRALVGSHARRAAALHQRRGGQVPHEQRGVAGGAQAPVHRLQELARIYLLCAAPKPQAVRCCRNGLQMDSSHFTDVTCVHGRVKQPGWAQRLASVARLALPSASVPRDTLYRVATPPESPTGSRLAPWLSRHVHSQLLVHVKRTVRFPLH
jgi:hypothetical protein